MSQESAAEDLTPVSPDNRTMNLFQYIPLWWAAVIVVQSMAVAFFAIYPQGQLNLLQVIVASLIGSVILGILFCLNGFPGFEEGIPFAVQTRSAFGVRGSIIPNYLRAVPAIVYLGIGNWIGALAINTITTTLWNFGDVRVYFVLFALLNVALAWSGIDSIAWFDTLSALVIVVLLAYTAYVVLTTQSIPTEPVAYEGSWGLPFVGFIAAVGGQLITAALNISDITRHLDTSRGTVNLAVGNILGLVPAYLFMLLVGLLFSVTTGITNPVEAIMAVALNAALGAAMLLFAILAQISTNLVNNLLPPTHVFQDSLGVTWKQGLVITTVLSFISFPWLLFSSALFSTFIQFYSAFLGPIVGILLADYWITRNRDTDIESLYDRTASSKFWFVRGFSVTGIVSLLAGVAVSLPVLDLSWVIGLPTAFVTYAILSKAELNSYVTESVLEDGTEPLKSN
ncbi:NCS1 family transporter [Halalkalicoccus subterraneus]|uniref:NCS1 family transporter n=1 Tax=Halalkalicoccus subterraneus TaxID=2675002 RepID=UPI000EFC79B1|nr:NCS1 family transporter [Halalkalicoccus subterraneus]